MRAAVVVFTRDLRVHDNPALAAACRAAERVAPLFVHDPDVRSSPNRDRFLAESLEDLRGSLRRRGGDLVIAHGDPVAEAVKLARQVGAEGIAMAADVSAYARRREQRLADACRRDRIALRLFAGVTVVAPDAIKPYRVFTPYHRAWLAQSWRDIDGVPRRIALPDHLPSSAALLRPVGSPSPGTAAGGEAAGRRRLVGWLEKITRYGQSHDDLAGDDTSRLSPYLHFGCVSARELAARAGDRDGAAPFVRQLCWRDFYHQLLLARPDLPRADLRERWRWRDRPDALDAWRAGRTGVPIVDAGMRQLAREGWMHNRARLITASYLTKHLGVDWRAGAAHFAALLVDADVANNSGNWQWVAGTGADTRPYRRFNPVRQAERHDPDGDYVRRYVPELADLSGREIREPWRLPAQVLRRLDYPQPLPEL